MSEPAPGIAAGAGADASWEWAVAQRTHQDEAESGDRSLVAARRDGVLLAVVDGLGHGGEAALAARAALDTIEAHLEEDLVSLVDRCHRALRRTRGAVIAVAVVAADGTMRWTGVGNVEAVVVRGDGSAREHAVLLAGTLGMQIPRIREHAMTLGPGDEVVFATDGVRTSFVDDLVVGAPQVVADRVLERWSTGRDDALVLVARYRGGSG